DLVLAAKVFDQAPAAGAEQRLLVLSQAMQEVEHGIVTLPGVAGVIVGRLLHAVADGLLENAAIDDIAIGPALPLCHKREGEENGEQAEGPAESRHVRQFTRSAGPAPGPGGPRAPLDTNPKPG